MYDGDKQLADEQIAAALAHEIKNPLSLIKANMDYLKSFGVTQEEFEKKYSAICACIDRITGITNDFAMALAKPYRFTDETHINLYGLADELIAVYAPAFDGKVSFVLQCDGNAKALTAAGNEKQLYLALSNLLKNAIEAIQENGTVRIVIGLQNDWSFIRVEDTGEGVADESRIFEKGYTTKNGGSGLGLTFCKNIAESFGGRIEAGNRAGGGFQATVWLPVAA